MGALPFCTGKSGQFLPTMASSGTCLRALRACCPINGSVLSPRRPILAPLSSTSRMTSSSSSYSSSSSPPPSEAGAVAVADGVSPPTKPAPKKKKGRAPRNRPNRDNNRERGLSVMRRTGPRAVLSVGASLPRPVDEADFPKVKTDPNHGLWEFFHEKGRALNTPQQDRQHGRAWKVEELRRKSWEDLHRLWWVCVKERNRISTGNWERTKGRYGYGSSESREREVEVRKTQSAIKHVLTERYYAWEDARKLAEVDTEIVFDKRGNVSVKSLYVEDE